MFSINQKTPLGSGETLFAGFGRFKYPKFTATITNSTTGAIGVSVSDSGSYYTAAPGLTITGGGDGSTKATVTAVISSGLVIAVNITSGNTTGFTAAPGVTFTGGGGSGAAATALFDNKAGAITRIMVTNPGSGYSSAPTVALATSAGQGTPATCTAVIAAKVTSVTVGGTNTSFTSAPVITATDAPQAEVISSPGYKVHAVLGPKALGISNTAENVAWWIPTIASDGTAMTITNGLRGSIVVVRTGTLGADTPFSLAWLGN